VDLLAASDEEKRIAAPSAARVVATPLSSLESSAEHSSNISSSFKSQEDGWKVACHFAVKRAIDIVASVAGLVLLSPLLLIVAAMVKLDSKGPIFFVQERWGRGGSRIRVLKFRTMEMVDCDRTGTRQTVIGDTRVSEIGGILRKTSIDELPQLVNVIKGDMSLVGPRCHPIGMLAGGMSYEKLVPNYHERHLMRPGITGLAQVNGYRGPTKDSMTAKKRIELDLEYIRRFNVWMDISIIFRTLKQEICGGSGL